MASKSKGTVFVFAIGTLCGVLCGQPTADNLSGKQPVAFQTVDGSFRRTSGLAFAAEGIDHTVLLSTNGSLELRLPGFGAAPALGIEMIGGNDSPVVTPEERISGTAFEYIGNDPSKWRKNIPLYAKLRYRSVYPGIDLGR